jgi:hypothetical protein
MQHHSQHYQSLEAGSHLLYKRSAATSWQQASHTNSCATCAQLEPASCWARCAHAATALRAACSAHKRELWMAPQAHSSTLQHIVFKALPCCAQLPALTGALAAQTGAQTGSSCDPQPMGSCTLDGRQEAQSACTTQETAAAHVCLVSATKS